ncbi:MAG: glycine cleavage system aminomethyltransferase GcvT [Sandaracinaceae bacterium]
MTDPQLHRTPLHDAHVALGAKLVPFAGYEMPVRYDGVKAEHAAVRQAAGLFDVSHMGELWLRGPEALAVADSLVTNAIHKLKVGHAKYTACCNEAGTILDDLIVYRPEEEVVMIVCNASNRAKIAPHVASHAEGRCRFEDASDDTALIALQGPAAVAIARGAGAPDAMLELGRFAIGTFEVGGVQTLVARTGYTGEDGFELFCANEHATTLWSALMSAGAEHGIAPVGLGARDTLRLEACLCLYGNDIDETTTPYEAGLGWVVKLGGPDFIGKTALQQAKQKGRARALVGFVMKGRGVARHGYPILDANGSALGEVTSGSPGPTVEQNIGLGYVPVAASEPGTKLGIQIRSKVVEAEVVKTPFYRRK